MHESSYRKVIIYLWVQEKYYSAQFIDLHTYNYFNKNFLMENVDTSI